MAEQKKQDTNQLLKVRREKLADLQANGKDPFQITKFDQTHHSLEVKNLYEAHEAEILKDRKTPDVEGLDEAQAREVLKKDYEERREIMDASLCLNISQFKSVHQFLFGNLYTSGTTDNTNHFINIIQCFQQTL